jgi:hypothetical protein
MRHQVGLRMKGMLAAVFESTCDSLCGVHGRRSGILCQGGLRVCIVCLQLSVGSHVYVLVLLSGSLLATVPKSLTSQCEQS